MLGFGKGGHAALALEDARFSGEDLMGLLGGFDPRCVLAGRQLDTYIRTGDDELDALVASWRDHAVVRFRGTGLLDENGEPGEQLARALSAIERPYLAASDKHASEGSSAALYLSDGAWTALRRAPGFLGGWSVVVLDPAAGIDAAFERTFGYEAVRGAVLDAEGYIRLDERDSLIAAINDGDDERLASLGRLRGIRTEPLMDLADSYGNILHNPKAYEFVMTDLRDCVLEKIDGMLMPIAETGYGNIAAVNVIPSKGFYICYGSAPKPGDPFDYQQDQTLADLRSFVRVGFVREGSLFEAATHIPEWYPEGATPIK